MDTPPEVMDKEKSSQLESAGGAALFSHSERPAHYVEIDPAAEARLRRKLDIRLLPLCTVMYLLNYIDRAAIGNARVAATARAPGLEVEIGLTGYQFNYALTIFYIFYILVEVPSNLIFKKVGSTYLAFLVFFFGVVTIGSAFVQNFGGLVATRIMLGISEGGLLPGIAYLLSRYYRRQELIFRIGFFLALSPSLSGAFGGLLATAFLKVPDAGPIYGWRKIFFYEGIITSVAGILAFWIFPTWPEQTKMLNEEERRIAIARLHNEENYAVDPDEHRYWASFGKAFTPITTVCIIGYSCINVSVQGLSTFMPTIIRTLGTYTAIEIQLLTVPPFTVAAVWSVFISYLSFRTQKRAIYIMISVPLAITGYIIFLATTTADPKARYAACFLCFTGVVPLGPFWLSWGLGSMPGRTSRAVLAALIPGLGTIGSVVSTWTYTNDFAPNYRPGNALNLGTTSSVFCLALLTLLYVKRENRRHESGYYDHLFEGKTDEQISGLGQKHPRFRFIE